MIEKWCMYSGACVLEQSVEGEKDRQEVGSRFVISIRRRQVHTHTPIHTYKFCNERAGVQIVSILESGKVSIIQKLCRYRPDGRIRSVSPDGWTRPYDWPVERHWIVGINQSFNYECNGGSVIINSRSPSGCDVTHRHWRDRSRLSVICHRCTLLSI